jgi:hypothetical protein
VLGLSDENDEHEHGDDRRDDGNREDAADVLGHRPHERDGEQRAQERTDRVERLAQAIARAEQMRWRQIGDERIARRTADALADAIEKTRRENPAERRCKRENGLRDCRNRVAGDDQNLALSEPITERAR